MTKKIQKRKLVHIEITSSEALVLFELINRINRIGQGGKILFEDQAEQRVLWDMESILEKSLAEPVAGNYKKELQRARGSVRDKVK